MPRQPLTAAHWGTYRVTVEGGRAVGLSGFEQDPDPSPIGRGILDVQDGPTRITAPMVRQSWLDHGPGAATERRGVDPFVALTWEEMEPLLAREITRVIEEHGNSAIYAGSYGWASAGRFHHAQSQLKRFLNCLGGFTSSVFTYSFAAAEAMVPHILGSFREFLNTTTSWDSIVGNTDLFVAFGGVPLKNGQIDSGGLGAHVQRSGLERARAAGTEFVNIGPLRSDMLDTMGAEWLAPRPNTDAAILLGIAHTLLDENLHDSAFLDRYTIGFAPFRAYLTGESDGQVKDADWAAGIAALEAEDIRALARRMAAGRTMISVAWSLTRQGHGEQTYWAAITVAAMLGQIGLPGGGFGFGYSASNSIGGHYDLMPGGSVPQGRNATPDFIPVARISDMLLNPGGAFDFDGQKLTYPDTRLVWWAGGNPFHHHQDLGRMLRAWRRPETVVVNEWCWNAMAKHADIVLPCTTPLERSDLCLSQRDPYVIAMDKVTEAPGLARDDHAILRGLARHLGVEEAFTEGRDEEAWISAIHEATRDALSQRGRDLPDLDTLRAVGWHLNPASEEPTVMLSDFRADPVAHALKTPIAEGDIVRVFNGRGACLCCACLLPLERDRLRLVDDQPGNGRRLVIGQVPVEIAVQVADGDGAIDQIRPIRLARDPVGVDIVLVRYIADDFLQNILQRDQPLKRAVFIDHQRKMTLAGEEGL